MFYSSSARNIFKASDIYWWYLFFFFNWRIITVLWSLTSVRISDDYISMSEWVSEVAQSCPTLQPHGLEPIRQEDWNGLPFPFPGDLPNPGIEPRSPALEVEALPSEPPGKLNYISIPIYICIYVCVRVCVFASILLTLNSIPGTYSLKITW